MFLQKISGISEYDYLSFKLQGNQANHKIRRSLLGLGKAGLGDALSTISESAVVFYDGKGKLKRKRSKLR